MRKKTGVLIMLLLVSMLTVAMADVEINETNFPDKAFRDYISDKADQNGDGVLIDRELENIKIINCPGRGITSLKGIEYFTELACLSCENNKLANLDVSKNTKLWALWCQRNTLQSLNLGNLPELEHLHCDSNQLTGLNVSGAKKLLELNCSSNQLTRLDLSEHSRLFGLRCEHNQLSELDISASEDLVSVYTRGVCSEHEDYYAYYYNDPDWWEWEDEYWEDFWESSMYWNLEDLYDRPATEIGNNHEMSHANRIESYSDMLNILAVDKTVEVRTSSEEGIFINLKNFPDNYFRKFVAEEYDANHNGVLNEEELAKAINMKVEVWEYDDDDEYLVKVRDLTGIAFFTSLEKLDCSNNNLYSLDVSKNGKLVELKCNGNKLETLNVSKATKLSHLECSSNQLTSFDLSDLIELLYLNCSDNRLATLDVNQNSKMTELYCYNNQLTSLDISRNTALQTLRCSVNKLKDLDVSHNTALIELYCRKNQLSSLNIGNNRSLKRLQCHANKLKKLDISNCISLVYVYEQGERTDQGTYWSYTGTERETGGFNKMNTGKPETTELELSFDKTVSLDAGAEVPEVGTIFTVDGLNYKVTNVKKNTVSFIGLKEAKSLDAVSIPATVRYGENGYKVTSVEDKALYQDSRARTVSLGKNITSVGKNAFASCTKIATITGGSGVVTISDSAFSGCKALKSFPVMSKLQKIGAGAFKGCIKLPKFTLGAKVKSIGKNAFNGCKALKNIEVKTTKLTDKNVGAAAFKGIYKKATFKCPAKKLKEYKKLFIKRGAPKTCAFEAERNINKK